MIKKIFAHPGRFMLFTGWRKKIFLLLFSMAFAALQAANLPQGIQTGENLFKDLTYRNLGPYRAGAWIGDIAAPENTGTKDRSTYYVAARNGCVCNTVNNVTTFKPKFDDYGVNAIGCVEVAPPNPDVLWVGHGEES